MTRAMNHPAFDQLMEQYLALESMEVTEELLDLCGARIDTHALPRLRLRLHEEQDLERRIRECVATAILRSREPNTVGEL